MLVMQCKMSIESLIDSDANVDNHVISLIAIPRYGDGQNPLITSTDFLVV